MVERVEAPREPEPDRAGVFFAGARLAVPVERDGPLVAVTVSQRYQRPPAVSGSRKEVRQ